MGDTDDTEKMDRMFSVDEARALLTQLQSPIATFVAQRAEFAELQWSLANDPEAAEGGVAELKALEAHLDAGLATVRDHGIEVKGLAPLLLDFPALHDGQRVLLCWLEGESTIDWYHRVELGFMGRRRL